MTQLATQLAIQATMQRLKSYLPQPSRFRKPSALWSRAWPSKKHVSVKLAVDDITPRVVQLDPLGSYTGTVRPGQISPKLKVDDVTGDWPILRTSGVLDAKRIKVTSGLCGYTPRGQMTVLAPGIFDGIECVRVLAP